MNTEMSSPLEKLLQDINLSLDPKGLLERGSRVFNILFYFMRSQNAVWLFIVIPQRLRPYYGFTRYHWIVVCSEERL